MENSIGYDRDLDHKRSLQQQTRYQRFLLDALEKHLAHGQIEFHTQSAKFVVGDSGRPILVKVVNSDFFRKVVCSGKLGMAESYVAGDFAVHDGRLHELLTVLLKAGIDHKLSRDAGFMPRYLWLRATNLVSGKAANVQRHDDIGDELYANYFRTIKQALSTDGRALVRAIGPYAKDQRNDMAIIDVENICRHYAVTTRGWLEAFRRNARGLDPQHHDATFRRMWEYYLCVGVAAALTGNLAVYQVLFGNDYHTKHPVRRV